VALLPERSPRECNAQNEGLKDRHLSALEMILSGERNG
jgi:hypothetical protein